MCRLIGIILAQAGDEVGRDSPGLLNVSAHGAMAFADIWCLRDDLVVGPKLRCENHFARFFDSRGRNVLFGIIVG